MELEAVFHEKHGALQLAVVNVGGDDVQVGDEVILFGDGIGAEDLADWAGTNEYEVMTNISARVPRVYLGAVQ